MDRPLTRRLVLVDEAAALEPCPFCGSTDVGFYEHMFAKDFAVICNLCGGEGPKRPTHEDAGRLWNKRFPS